GGVGAAGAGGARVTVGAGVPAGTAATGPGGARTRGTRAAGTSGVRGAGVGDPTVSVAGGAGGSGAGGAKSGGAGVGGVGAEGAGVGGTGAGGAGAGGAGVVDPGGTVRPRPYFSHPSLQPASPPPAPSPYTEQTGGLTERRAPASRPASPVRTARRVPRPRPPPVPGTHAMTLRPSSVPQRVPLPTPPGSSLPEVPNPESDRARATSPTVSRLLATAATKPSLESAAASALVAELLEFAAASRLDYATALEFASASPPSVGGECALGTDVLEDTQEDFECLSAALPRFASMLLALEGDPDAPEIPTPRSYTEAITATYVDKVPPPGANIVDGMWIFRVKRPPGSPPAFKARYVARGFSHRQGVDYFQTFSPTPKMTTLRMLLHVAAQRDYELLSLDFSTAFLTTLAALGFASSTADPSLFLRTDTSLPPFYVLVYVDDLVFATADTEALSLVKSDLQKRHTCTDLGELRSYLGLQFTRDRARRTITLTQSHMVHQSVEPSGLYPELVGCLMYLMTCTRPDLAYPLSLLARYVAPDRHRKVHWDATKRVLRYLCSTSGMGLLLGGRGPVVLTGHADASFVDDPATQRSSQGYTFILGSGIVSWRSSRLSSVLSSSCEAEIYAGAMAAQELRWLTYLLTDLGEQPCSPPVLYVDNKAMIALCQELRLEHRTKHMYSCFDFLDWSCDHLFSPTMPMVSTGGGGGGSCGGRGGASGGGGQGAASGGVAGGGGGSGGGHSASIEAASLDACEFASKGAAPSEALHTFTLDSSASRCFFRDCTTVTPLTAPVHVTLANPLSSPDVARGTNVLPYLEAPFGSHIGFHLPSFATNLSAQVASSGQVVASCSCRLLTHPSLLWHHRLGHPSLQRLRRMHSRLLVSGLPSLSPRFQQDFPVLHLHSDRGGDFSSRILEDICHEEGITQSFTLLASPQHNGIAERRIGLIMEVARTFMIHAAAPHFLCPFAVRYTVHQLNLWPRVSEPETSPTLHWTGKVGDASAFWVWDSLALVRDTTAGKLSSRTVCCVFLGFPTDVSGWQIYHPATRPPGCDPAIGNTAASCRSPRLETPPSFPPMPPVSVDSGAVGGGGTGGMDSEGANARGANFGGVECGGVEPGAAGGAGGARGAGAGGAAAGGAGSTGAGGPGARGAGGTGGTGAGGSGGSGGATQQLQPRPFFWSHPHLSLLPPGPALHHMLSLPSFTGTTPLLHPPPDSSQIQLQPNSPLPAPSPYTELTDSLTERREPASRLASYVRTICRVCPPPVPGTHTMALRPSSFAQCVALPSPPASSLPGVPYLESDLAHASSPTVTRCLAMFVTNPTFGFAAVSAFVTEQVDFAAACHLDYLASLVFEVKRPLGSPLAFKAGYVARGFSQRQGVDFFHTFSPTLKMTTLRVLLHIAAQRDYELHSLDFSTAFLLGNLHEEIWLCRPPGFTGSFPEWHDALRTTLAALGFAPSTADPSLFLRTDPSLLPFYILVYVDDLVIATADTEALSLVKAEL
ncbi:unnamed protein product, partial [Closterium sp. NIES-53]